MKIGDKVRFLSEVGGGVVSGFQSKDIVLVRDEDGFDIPMPVRECVVVETDDYNIAKVNTGTHDKAKLESRRRHAGRQWRRTRMTVPWHSSPSRWNAGKGRN